MGTCLELKRARPLYIELSTLGLGLRAVREARGVRGYRVEIPCLDTLPEDHAKSIRRRVEESQSGLVALMREEEWDTDARHIRAEGAW